MKIQEFNKILEKITEVKFLKPDGTFVPSHFHITEVGQIDKNFIDCGGTIRKESVISMQLWESIDYWHRLEPSKLISIINVSKEKLNIQDLEIEIEYQSDTIGKYNLEFENNFFKLIPTKTACLASDSCGISSTIINDTPKSACPPNSGCC